MTRQVELTAQQMLDELTRTINATDVGVVRCSRDLRYVWANDVYARLTGIPAEQLVGRHIGDVLGEGAIRLIRPYIDKVLAGESVDFDVQFPFSAANQRWINVTYTPWADPDGVVVGWVATVVDIARRKRAEEKASQAQLELSRELGRMTRVQALTARMTQAGDLQALLQEILAAAAELTGTDKGNIQLLVPETGQLRIVVHQGLGRRVVEYFAEHGWSASGDPALLLGRRVIVEDVTREPSVQGTLGLEIVLEDGIRAIQCTPLLARDGRFLGMLNNHFRQVHRPSESDLRYLDLLARMAADLIERNQAQHAIQESERRLEAELEAMRRLHALSSRLLSAVELPPALEDVLHNAMASCGADFGNIQVLDPQTRTLRIIAQQGFDADFLDYFRVVRMDDGSACAQALQHQAAVVIEDVTRDSEYRPHRSVAAAAGYRSVTSTPLKAHDGEIVGMLSVHFREAHRPSERDVRLLDLYARHGADLLERVHFVQALQDADRRKNEFLATLAHELRNPLAPLKNALTILEGEPNQETMARARHVMARQLDQMVRLIDDLLDVSRISRGKLDLRTEPVELARIIEDAVETCRPVVDHFQHHLVLGLPSETIVVNADPVRLAQVFGNLLHNACKFTPACGRIVLAVEQQDGDAVVSVTDNGIGIPFDKLDSIFEIFSQLDRNLEMGQGGLGIGLSLVKRLVELHRGTVTVQSEGPGKGARFAVRLPAVAAAQPRPASPASEPASSTPCRILVVDDSRDNAESLAMLLQLSGHQTYLAFDGEEAVRAAGRHRPDVVLLDIGLPRLNGHEACRRIREQERGRDILMIALTGWGQEEDRRKSFAAGFDGHLVKPVDHVVILRLLDERAASPVMRLAPS